MNNKFQSKVELAQYIHQKINQKLEEIDLFMIDLDQTITDMERIVTNDRENS